MKATATLILTIFTLISALGQSEQANQLTKEGVKTGKWIEYDSDGNVTSIKVYKAVKRKVSDEELFLNDGKVPSRYHQSDSTVDESLRIGKWINFGPNGDIREIEYFDDSGYPKVIDRYSHNSSGLQVVTRISGNQTTYIIGDRDSLEFSNLTFYEIRPTNDFFEVKTLVKNISDSDVTFRVLEQVRLKVPSNTYIIKTRDSIYI